MTTYQFDQQLVADPYSFARAVDAEVLVVASDDTTNAVPLALQDLNGVVLPNPLTSSRDGFIPAFRTTTPQVKLVAGDLVVPAASYAAVLDEARAARAFVEGIGVAETITVPFGDPASMVMDSQGKMTVKLPTGAPGLPGPGSVPADSAVAAYINRSTTETAQALAAQVGPVQASVTTEQAARQGADATLQAQINGLATSGMTVAGAWSAQPYAARTVVTYGGVAYLSKTATIAGDVPGTSALWAAWPNGYDPAAVRRADPGVPVVDAQASTTWQEVSVDAQGRVVEGIDATGTRNFPTVNLAGAVESDDRAGATDTGYQEVSIDAQGRVIEGIDRDGRRFFTEVAIAGAATTEDGVSGSGYISVETDAAGVIIQPTAIDAQGRTPDWVLEAEGARRRTAVYGVACVGDSLTWGLGGTPYPTTLAGLIPVPVTNYGISGHMSSEIALRAGALTVSVTVTGGQIPADTSPVPVTVLPTGTWRGGYTIPYPGTLAGVVGTLTWASNAWTFTRATAGAPVTVLPETPFVYGGVTSYVYGTPSGPGAAQPMTGLIYWAGRNNPSDTATILRDAHAVAQKAQRLGTPYLILSPPNSGTEPSGSAGYVALKAAWDQLATEHGEYYFDVRGWLIRNGLQVAGITPTHADTDRIAADQIPASLMNDNLHLNSAGYTAVAKILATVTTAKGWYTP